MCQPREQRLSGEAPVLTYPTARQLTAFCLLLNVTFIQAQERGGLRESEDGRRILVQYGSSYFVEKRKDQDGRSSRR
jgi:hypothetical protein